MAATPIRARSRSPPRPPRRSTMPARPRPSTPPPARRLVLTRSATHPSGDSGRPGAGVARPDRPPSVPVPSLGRRNDDGPDADPRMTLVRRLVDHVFPRGALILSILSLGYFAMGVL